MVDEFTGRLMVSRR
ncbi:MAG: hypothetical protein ACLUI3_11500 [Christensenellales bacterium]